MNIMEQPILVAMETLETRFEALIEMVELTSPTKKLPRLKLKKRNQVHSPPFMSPTRSTDKDVTSLFSVKKVSRKSSPNEDDTETISELSDDLLSESSLKNLSKTESGESSARSIHISKLRRSLDKIKHESCQVDASIKSVRSRFQLEENRTHRPDFSFFKLENLDEENILDEIEELVQYVLPENFRLNINLAERESLLSTFTRKKLVQEDIGSAISNPVLLQTCKPDIQIQKGDCTMYYPPTNQLADIEEVVIIKNNILELSLSHLQFVHHPLFSLEHVLQEKLEQVFKKYSRIVADNTIQKLKEQLQVLRNARKLKRDDSSQSADISIKDLKKVRENLFKEGKAQRARLKSVLNIWRAIKKLRARQKYSNTNVRLLIKKEKLELSVEKETYNNFFEEILQDILEEHKAAYKKKFEEYNKKMKAKEEALSNRKSDSDGGDKEESDLDKPIFNVDRHKLDAELRTKFGESFKPADEPHILIYLRDDHEVTEDVNNDPERDRRKVMSSTKFSVKILCNNIPVCKSKYISWNDPLFALNINEMFCIQLANIPKFLSLEIFEHPKGLLKKKIAELKVEIPNVSILYSQAKYTEIHFEKREIVHYKHTGVGSGYNIKKMLEENEVALNDVKFDLMELYTKGSLLYRIGWQSSQLESTSSNDQNTFIPHQMSGVITKWGAVDGDRFQNWLDSRPRDFEDKFGINEFLDANNTIEPLWWNEDSQYFRLSPFTDKVIFCTMDDIERNIRFQYLKLREQNEIEFDGILIPNRVKEIPFALLKDFKKRKALEAIHDNVLDEDPGTLRDTGKRRLKQIHTRIFHICKGLSNNLCYESIVDEKYLIYFEEVIKTSLKNFINWFRWRPKLNRPLPRIIKKSVGSQMVQKILPKPQNKILIKILSGKNIPERKSNDRTAIGTIPDEVQPFLEISYEDFFSKTSVVTGSNPIWNEFVELPLQCHHADYLNLNALNGSISINLFDYVQTDTSISNEDQIEEKFWLGEIKIPLAAFTTGLNLFGWFKVMKPPMLFGYQTWDEQHVSKSPKHVNQEVGSDETYIQLDLRISPSIPSLDPNMADLPSNDVPYIKDHILKWTDVFNSSFPSKKFNGLAIDTNGRTNCITRYLRPLEPPQLNNEEFDMKIEQCLRYVSLIPFTECNHFYQNVWLTSDQLLNLMIGSVVDHCVALTCFLLALKIDAYLLLGYGIPHGSTCYVLVSEYSRQSELPLYYVLDVVYNKKFYLTDPFCPLQRVYCVANGENVWGNTQKTQNPALLRFDLARRSDWWTLFNNDISAPSNFVNNKINFALERDFEDLERQLERRLKKKISKWRPMERTNFNHRVAEVFKNGLRFFEMNAMYGRSNTEALMEVNKATSQYRVNGTVLNIPFTSIHAIVKKIKSLNIHVQQQSLTEFGLSVFVQSYPGQVLSVWIFIGWIFDKFSS